MKYFLDTEFQPDPLVFISVGVVAEDGREYYAENGDVSLQKIAAGPSGDWLMKNVIPLFTGPVKREDTIRKDLTKFVGLDPAPEFWCWMTTYDWWIITDLFGGYSCLPNNWPKYANEIMEMHKKLTPLVDVYKIQNDRPMHNALNDAWFNKKLFDTIREEGQRLYPNPHWPLVD